MKMAVTKRKSSSAVIYPCKDSFIYSFFYFVLTHSITSCISKQLLHYEVLTTTQSLLFLSQIFSSTKCRLYYTKMKNNNMITAL